MMRVFVYEHLSGSGSIDAADGELLEAGVAMRDAVVADLLQAGHCEVSAAAVAGVVPHGAEVLRPPTGTSAVGFVARQARLHDIVWVIAPETDGVLGELQAAVEDARWLGCDAGAIALASSKRATLAQADEHGITTPLAFVDSPATRRWVVKPDDGAGTLATRVHDTLAAARSDAAARRRDGRSATLEAWVGGEPLSLSLLCSGGRGELLSINRQRFVVDAYGVLSFRGVQIVALAAAGGERVAALQAWADSVCTAFPGLGGYVGVDLVWHAQRGPVLIEVNPRVTTAYVGLSRALDRNLAGAVLAAHVEASNPAREQSDALTEAPKKDAGNDRRHGDDPARSARSTR